MSGLYLLDSDTASYLIRGRAPDVEARFAAIPPSEVFISAITRAELLFGLERLPEPHQLRVKVARFLALVPTLPWESDAARHYARIRHQLVTSGRPIGDMDMLIAAHALALPATLVTNNRRHFERIVAPLEIVSWRDE